MIFSSFLNLFRLSLWHLSSPLIWRFTVPRSNYLLILPCFWITAKSFCGLDPVGAIYIWSKVLMSFLGVVKFSMKVHSFCGLLNSGWSFNFLQICREFTLLQRHGLTCSSTRSRPGSHFSEYVKFLFICMLTFISKVGQGRYPITYFGLVFVRRALPGSWEGSFGSTLSVRVGGQAEPPFHEQLQCDSLFNHSPTAPRPL